MGWKVVLTSDRATMTDYNDTPSLGFGHCVPYRLVPRPVYTKLLAPPMKVDGKGRAVYA
ncbi:MAG TPA: radical SAM protein, partial [Candidatus Bathyarchaeota archaeon]|nr:radical SAM protein [Candidatus Bathyarchaeota archaeon]